MPATHADVLCTSRTIRCQQHALHLQDDQISTARAGALHTSNIVKATPHGIGSLLHCRKPSATMWCNDRLPVNAAATLRNTMDSRHSATRVGFLVRSSSEPLFPLTHFAQHNSLHWCHAHHAHKVTHCCRGASPQNKSKWAHDPKLEPVQHARIELGNSFLSIAKLL